VLPDDHYDDQGTYHYDDQGTYHYDDQGTYHYDDDYCGACLHAHRPDCELRLLWNRQFVLLREDRRGSDPLRGEFRFRTKQIRNLNCLHPIDGLQCRRHLLCRLRWCQRLCSSRNLHSLALAP